MPALCLSSLCCDKPDAVVIEMLCAQSVSCVRKVRDIRAILEFYGGLVFSSVCKKIILVKGSQKYVMSSRGCNSNGLSFSWFFRPRLVAFIT